MSHKRLAIAALIIICIVIGGFILSVPHVREEAGAPAPQPAASSTPAVTLSSTYKNGVRTLSGSLTAPDACTAVSASASLANASTTEIVLDISMPESLGVCLTLPTERTFSASVEAPADLPVLLRVNGAPATTTP